MQNWIGGVCLLTLVGLSGCGQEATSQTHKYVANEKPEVLIAQGQWLKDESGKVMVDPQTSGLTVLDNELVTISDGSALAEHQRKLHYIAPETAVFHSDPEPFSIATRVRRSCFYDYLSNEPDLEALVTDPDDHSVLYTVTEDATRTGALSAHCQQRYEKTGSTDYPTLLVRLERSDDGKITMTHVRPIQFAETFAVGDFPNDGIEGMAMDESRTLYLGLEKDAAGKARIFSLKLDGDFWQSDEFATVDDPGLDLPDLGKGNHPINGLAWYAHRTSNQGYLLAAARNDNELWIIPTSPGAKAKRIRMGFTAPTLSIDGTCPVTIDMDNASIEGLVTHNNTLWMINDPWKKNYLKNATCQADLPRYEAMAPLLFSIELHDNWFSE